MISLLVVMFKPIYFRLATVPLRDLTQLLLTHGASLEENHTELKHFGTKTIPTGMTPLALAAYRRHHSVLGLLAEKQTERITRHDSEESIEPTQRLSQEEGMSLSPLPLHRH